MSTEITSGQRIAEYRKSMGLSQQQLAETINVSRSYLGDIEAGRSEPSANFLTSLVKQTDVSSDWLLTGEGPMRRSGAGNSPTPTDPERAAMLTLYEALDPDQRREILQVAQEKKRLNEVERQLAELLQRLA
jgi:transcriptional regulator with XRE-family HTH domain